MECNREPFLIAVVYECAIALISFPQPTLNLKSWVLSHVAGFQRAPCQNPPPIYHCVNESQFYYYFPSTHPHFFQVAANFSCSLLSASVHERRRVDVCMHVLEAYPWLTMG